MGGVVRDHYLSPVAELFQCLKALPDYYLGNEIRRVIRGFPDGRGFCGYKRTHYLEPGVPNRAPGGLGTLIGYFSIS